MDWNVRTSVQIPALFIKSVISLKNRKNNLESHSQTILELQIAGKDTGLSHVNLTLLDIEWYKGIN